MTLALAACSVALVAAAPAAATYSIVAVDLVRDESGGAGTSCVGAQVTVSDILGSAPGFGVVVAQAALNRNGRDRAVMLLMQGQSAPDVLAQITATTFDGRVASRQYAIVDVNGMAVGFTGGSNSTFADDVQGKTDRFAYSVQGNILTGAAVLEQAAAELEAPGCDLADTLMRALEAGARNGQGDRRCTPNGIPSDGAFIQVDRAGAPAGSYLRLRVDDTAPNSPIVALRGLYDAWRREHPCPDVIPPLDAGAGTDAGAGVDAGALDGGVTDAARPDATAVDAATEDPLPPSQAGVGGAPPVTVHDVPVMAPSAPDAQSGAAGAPASAASEPSGCATARPRRDGSSVAARWIAALLIASALRIRTRRRPVVR